MKTERVDVAGQNKRIVVMALVIAAILLTPLVAMQFTREVNWDGFDFAVAAVLLIGTAAVFEVVARKVRSVTYRAAIGVAILAALLVVWAELAVGVFGTPIAGT